MLKVFKYYLPKYYEAILLLFINIFIGGVGATFIFVLLYGENFTKVNPIIMYLLPMTPLFIYILIRGYIEKNNISEEKKEVVLNRNIFRTIPISRTIIIFVLLFIATQAISFAIDPITNLFEIPEALLKLYKQLNDKNIYQFITVVICAPFVEEFLFRGIIERGLLHHSKGAVFPIFFSAFLFGLIHLNLYQGVGAILIGLFLGWIYYRTHNLWSVIFIHLINNATAYLFSTIIPEEMLTDSFDKILIQYGYNPNLYIYIVIGGLLATTVSIYLLHKLLPCYKNSFK